MGASRCFTHLELSQPTGIFLIPLPLYLNAQECSPTYMASARHYFYLKFRSIFAHQKHMLRRVKCTQSAHNEEHLGAHNLSSLLNCPEPCEYVYLCYRNSGNTVLLSRLLNYMSIHDLSYGGPCYEDTFRSESRQFHSSLHTILPFTVSYRHSCVTLKWTLYVGMMGCGICALHKGLMLTGVVLLL